MHSFTICTDSMSDLPQNYAREHGVVVIPAHYTIAGREYEDVHDDAINHEYYEKMRGDAAPTTSQVNVEQFLSCWEPLLQSGETILHVAFSSALSGTCSAGFVARDLLLEKYPDAKIYLSDSVCASLGFGLLIIKLVGMRDAGVSAQEAHEWVEKNKTCVHHWFTVASLKYLYRGGRVSASSAFLGTVLDIKPILNVNRDGKLIPISKVKGRKKALRMLVEKFDELASRSDDELVGISHGDCQEDCDFVVAQLKDRGVKDVVVSRIGALIGCHSGPDTVALFFFGPDKTE